MAPGVISEVQIELAEVGNTPGRHFYAAWPVDIVTSSSLNIFRNYQTKPFYKNAHGWFPNLYETQLYNFLFYKSRGGYVVRFYHIN